MQEKQFEIEMENNVTILGRIDQVNRIARGEVEVVDYKTGKPKIAKGCGCEFAIERVCAGGGRGAGA